MHELAIAENIIKVITEQCQLNKSKCITKVKVKVGALTMVLPSSLAFAFDIAKENTIARNAQLEIENVPVSIYCKKCQKVSLIPRGDIYFVCPDCGSTDLDLRSGRELYIESIEV